MRNIFRGFLIFIFFFITTPLYAEQSLIVEPDMGRSPLLSAINNSHSSVDLVMYGFTDLKFAEALIAAHQKNKQVRVLLQHYPYKAENENLSAVENLQAAHIDLAWPDGDYKLTHQKTLLIDHATAIVMTFNLTHSTFKNERNFALYITDPALVQEIQQVFDNDWQHKKTSVAQSDLVWSPNNSREKIIALIRSAKSSIKMYAEGLTDYQIVGALASAAKSGVKVEIITSTQPNQRPSKQAGYLIKSGVKIGYSNEFMIHAKVIMVDQSRAILGSINMTKASINDNRELAVLTHDNHVLTALNTTFEHDWLNTNVSATTSPRSYSTRTPDPTYYILRTMHQVARLNKASHKHKRKHYQM